MDPAATQRPHRTLPHPGCTTVFTVRVVFAQRFAVVKGSCVLTFKRATAIAASVLLPLSAAACSTALTGGDKDDVVIAADLELSGAYADVGAVYQRALAKVHDAIREGESFAAPLRAAKVCDAIVTNMIDVGEETGDLDKMLLKVADNYDEEVDVLVASLVSLLEPVMVVVLGGIVGTIVVALFLPLVKLIQSVSGSKS